MAALEKIKETIRPSVMSLVMAIVTLALAIFVGIWFCGLEESLVAIILLWPILAINVFPYHPFWTVLLFILFTIANLWYLSILSTISVEVLGRMKKNVRYAVMALVLILSVVSLMNNERSCWGLPESEIYEIEKIISRSILDTMDSEGSLLAFFEDELVIRLGKENTLYFGIKNQHTAERHFSFEVVCIEQDGTKKCDSLRMAEAGYGTEWFRYFDSSIIPGDEAKILPIKVTITEAEPGTYAFRLEARERNETGTAPEHLYASEEFTVVVR